MGCKYCNNDVVLLNSYIFDGVYPASYDVYIKDSQLILSDVYDKYEGIDSEIKINYCPMCGIRLSDENE